MACFFQQSWEFTISSACVRRMEQDFSVTWTVLNFYIMKESFKVSNGLIIRVCSVARLNISTKNSTAGFAKGQLLH